MADERPQLTKNRTRYTFYPHTQSVPDNAEGPVCSTARSDSPQMWRFLQKVWKALWSLLAVWMAAIRSM